jgi:hypothetical protein
LRSGPLRWRLCRAGVLRCRAKCPREQKHADCVARARVSFVFHVLSV